MSRDYTATDLHFEVSTRILRAGLKLVRMPTNVSRPDTVFRNDADELLAPRSADAPGGLMRNRPVTQIVTLRSFVGTPATGLEPVTRGVTAG